MIIRADDLRFFFERIGPVHDVHIPVHYHTREPRGLAYIRYELAQDAENAVRAMNGAHVLGRRIKVDWLNRQQIHRYKRYHSYHRSFSKYSSSSSYRCRLRHSDFRSRKERASSNNSTSTSSSLSRNHRKSINHKSQASSKPSAHSEKTKKSCLLNNKETGALNESTIKRRTHAGQEIFDDLEMRSEASASDMEIDNDQTQTGVSDRCGGIEKRIEVSISSDEDRLVMDMETGEETLDLNGTFCTLSCD
ncbi:unnamed protein product [Thelazia callipaeda]|uniref:RRM domain-containing protein n=1 Tax=Thelazia callipaeda TaxID=103827 RepID=A0A0N5D6J6_THECL|nr:unnamed protein product [Thelazia callipaeda]